jgi:hypothetical protein
MALPRLRRMLTLKPSAPLTADKPREWPVDPELKRRVEESRRRIEHTRRQLARHVLPDRKRQR